MIAQVSDSNHTSEGGGWGASGPNLRCWLHPMAPSPSLLRAARALVAWSQCSFVRACRWPRQNLDSCRRRRVSA